MQHRDHRRCKMDARRGPTALHVGLTQGALNGTRNAVTDTRLATELALHLHSMDTDVIPSAGPAPAVDTVTSLREGCKSVLLRAARPGLRRMRERTRDQGGPGTLTD